MAKVDIWGGVDMKEERAREWCAVLESSFPPRCEQKSLESGGVEEWSVLTIVMFSNQHLYLNSPNQDRSHSKNCVF